jgi:hypothetical protein
LFNEVCVVGDHVIALASLPGAPVGTPVESPQGATSIRESAGVQVAVLNRSVAGWQYAKVDADLGLLDFPRLLCSSTSVLVYTNSLTHVWSFDPRTGEWQAQPSAPADLTKRPDFGGPVKVNLPVEFGSAAWTGQSFVFWNAETVLDSNSVLQSQGAPKQLVRPGNAVEFDIASGEWRAATPGPALSPLTPRSAAWVDGFAFVPALMGSQPGFVTYRPSAEGGS